MSFTPTPYPFPDTTGKPAFFIANLPRTMEHIEKVRLAHAKWECARFGRYLKQLYPATHGHIGPIVEREMEEAKAEYLEIVRTTPSIFRFKP